MNEPYRFQAVKELSREELSVYAQMRRRQIPFLQVGKICWLNIEMLAVLNAELN